MTELEAVNQCLSRIGETPVNSLKEADLTDDAAAALKKLNISSRELQSKGWHFNTEVRELQPDIEGNIYLPKNTLRVDLAQTGYSKCNPIQRGERLFDLTTNSYTWAVPVKLKLIVMLSFDELPEAARTCILAQAKYDLYVDEHGVSEVTNVDREQYQVAYKTLLEADLDNADRNILRDNVDSYILNNRWATHSFW